ncbi:hypothetical protein, partial [Microseira sp. BLCC-F43]|uniref:hypothetical protein n=1 Tax=Microseira sp. BLCC-F43 TaxID=3153602 RepID=UPI0035BA0570
VSQEFIEFTVRGELLIHESLLLLNSGLGVDKIRFLSQASSLVMTQCPTDRQGALAWRCPASVYNSGQTPRVLCKTPNINLCK